MAASQRLLAVRSTTLETVHDALSSLVTSFHRDDVLTRVEHIPARTAQVRPMPQWVRPELAAAYRAKGVADLYSHQALTADLAHDGKNVVVVTPTASGKPSATTCLS